MFRHKDFSDFMQEKPEILIRNGTLDSKAMSKLNITSDKLKEAMREHGVEYFKDVKLAMLEIDGHISIISGDTNLTQTHYKRKRKHKSLSRGN